MQCLSWLNLDSAQSAADAKATLCRVQHFVDVHPLSVEVERRMNDALVKINNPELDEMWRTARQRYTDHSRCIG